MSKVAASLKEHLYNCVAFEGDSGNLGTKFYLQKHFIAKITLKLIIASVYMSFI